VVSVPELGCAGELVESVGRCAGGGGDDGDDDDDAEVVAVASARARTNDSVLLLCAETLCGWMDSEFVSEHMRLLAKKSHEGNVTIDVAWPRVKQREVNDGRASLSSVLCSRVLRLGNTTFVVCLVVVGWRRTGLAARRAHSPKLTGRTPELLCLIGITCGPLLACLNMP
jgi:hypothetical protein